MNQGLHHIPEALDQCRILVTNDDGIHADGIHILAELMRSFGADVWMVAPEREQSGAGHSLTLHRPLRARQLGERQFSVSGTPTDCVLLAVKEIIPEHMPVDFIVSGINHGDNMAEHVTYSGTIAATMEGTLLGYPSIAFSRAIDHTPLQWETSKRAVHEVMEHIRGFSWNPGSLLSVNIPDCQPEALQPVCVATQGKRSAIEGLDCRTDPRGNHYYWIGGVDYDGCQHEPGTDCALLAANHTIITPISMNFTDHAMMNHLKQHVRPRDDAA